MIIIIDNYDSFTYNLLHLIKYLYDNTIVIRNDLYSAEHIISMQPNCVIISPGPCSPDEAGVSLKIVELCLHKSIPLLGVCLGHQAIAQVMGGKIVIDSKPYHGKVSLIRHQEDSILKGIENPFKATRYHSLTVKRDSLPSSLKVICETDEGKIMGISHCSANIHGLQFHPESILTHSGHQIIKNFLELSNII